ncbi:MAG: murein biosynthesis integral membrane protein MurJ [Anaerolineae bacterium]|nr:murein biosynthesis integral membrane protein MurJ [Anaerolineae bacterium]
MTTTAELSRDAVEQSQHDLAQRNRRLAWSTLVVAIAFGIAKIISLGQTVIIAGAFGVGREWDAFVSANRMPELLVTLIAGGALGHAFLPVFSGYLAQGDQKTAWRLASHVLNTVFVVALLTAGLAFVAAPWLMQNLIAPGFEPATAARAAELMRILLLTTVIFAVSGLIQSILQSHQHFFLPALAPILYDVGILFGVLVLLPRLGIHGVALGALIGAGLHFLVQLPGLVYFKARWYPEPGWRDPQLWRVIRLMIPGIIGLGVFQFNMLLLNNLGSRLGEGAVSALDWGWRLMQIPQTLIGTAMGIVIFPTLAALSATGNLDGKRNAMSGALRFILVASIPAAVGLWSIGQALISLLERGAFDASASALVYATLRAFTLGLIVHSLLEVVARSFYADKDTLTPLWASLLGAVINVGLALALSNVGAQERYALLNLATVGLPLVLPVNPAQVGGLALANSLGTTAEVLLLLWLLQRRWQGIHRPALVRATVKALVASVLMGLAVAVIGSAWAALGLAQRGLVWTVAQLVLQVVGGGLVFVAAAVVLKMEEVQELLQIVLRRTGRAAGAAL